MNLSIEQVSKLTKLSIPTLYAYTSRQKLGKRVGKRKVFSQADVQKLLKASKKSLPKKTAKPPVKNVKVPKRATNLKPIKASAAKPKNTVAKPSGPVARAAKPSFWTRLFRGGRQKQKVSLLDAKITK